MILEKSGICNKVRSSQNIFNALLEWGATFLLERLFDISSPVYRITRLSAWGFPIDNKSATRVISGPVNNGNLQKCMPITLETTLLHHSILAPNDFPSFDLCYNLPPGILPGVFL